MQSFICLTAIFIVAQVPANFRDRERHPLAPSLPRLTKDEEKKIDAAIERLIDADTGKIKGDDAKKAHEDFNALGPEAFFNLVEGLNRAANMESSCPAVIIAKKVARIVTTTDDLELLQFAKENIGADVKAKRHLNVLKDLQSMILVRKAAVQRTNAARGWAKAPITMSLPELEKAITKGGPHLKTLLAEAESRQGPKAVDALLIGVASSDANIAKLSQGLLAKNVQHQSGDNLKTLLKHDRKEVRIAAAGAVAAKKLRYGPELIALLQDGDEDVRQAGRAALKQISGGMDHGPERDADSEARVNAVNRWLDWWGKQK